MQDSCVYVCVCVCVCVCCVPALLQTPANRIRKLPLKKGWAMPCLVAETLGLGARACVGCIIREQHDLVSWRAGGPWMRQSRADLTW